MSLRLWLVWVLGSAAVLVPLASVGLTISLRQWPEQVVPRLPTPVLPTAHLAATDTGKSAIADRWVAENSVDRICAMLRGDPQQQACMLDAIGRIYRYDGSALDSRIIDALGVPGDGPDPVLRDKAMHLFASFSFLLHEAQNVHRRHTEQVSALAVQAWCLVAAVQSGYDHRMPSRHKTALRKILDLVLAAGDAQGRYGDGLHDQALVVLALADLYASTSDTRLEPVLTQAQARLAELGEVHWSQDHDLAALTLVAQGALSMCNRADIDHVVRLHQWWQMTRTQNAWLESTSMTPWQRKAWDACFASIFHENALLQSIDLELPPSGAQRPSRATWWLEIASIHHATLSLTHVRPLIASGMDDTRFAPWRRPLTTGDLQARAIALLQSGMDYRWPTDFRLRYGAPAADMPRPANASGGGMP